MKKILYFVLGLITADNLGIHQVLGYIENFNSNSACRFCKMHISERTHCCEADISLLRNNDNFNIDILKTDPRLSGIKENSIFNELPGFHVLDNITVDYMHDGPEGFFVSDMVEIIKYCTTKATFFSMERLNNIIVSFDYGPYSTNVPPPIPVDHIKNDKINMSAAEMLTFVRHFGLMVGHFVPENDSVWNFYSILRQLTDLLTAPAMHRDCISLIRTLIRDHNSKLIELFQKPLKPKAHHLVHYPEVLLASGPTVHLWSMRSESKHRQSKITAAASNCRINICATLALKHQLRLAYQFLSGSIFSDTLEIGPVSNVLVSDLSLSADQNIFEEPDILLANWISHCRKKFKPGSVICIGMDDNDENDLPRFSIIKYVALDVNKHVFFIHEELDVIGFKHHLYAYEYTNIIYQYTNEYYKRAWENLVVFRQCL